VQLFFCSEIESGSAGSETPTLGWLWDGDGDGDGDCIFEVDEVSWGMWGHFLWLHRLHGLMIWRWYNDLQSTSSDVEVCCVGREV
jgi:hypothetical protein